MHFVELINNRGNKLGVNVLPKISITHFCDRFYANYMKKCGRVKHVERIPKG